MSKRTKFLLGIGVIAALVIGWQVAAFAVHADAFELDGNGTDETSGTNDPNNTLDDWINVCNDKTYVPDPQCDTTPPPTGATTATTATNGNAADETAFLSEPANTTAGKAATVFTGGGSKDELDIPNNWEFKGDGGLPDKDNLVHSYAALYQDEDLLYFGADRYDNSGDAALGFWFFKSPVALDPNPAPDDQAGHFTGQHTDGDLLIISNFSNGGQVSDIFAYLWDDTCGNDPGDDPIVNAPEEGDCAANNLRLDLEATNATCVPPATAKDPDRACAIVNESTTTLPWQFDDKTTKGPGAGANTALKSEFFEGGVDLGALGLADACFTTAMAETRSSTSTDAVLKDFTIGPFGSCGSSVTTDESTGGSASIGTGTVSVSDSATVEVSGANIWEGTVQFSLRGPIGSPIEETEDIGGPVDVSNTTPTVQSEAATVTAAGDYCWSATFVSETDGVPGGVDNGVNECFTVNPVTPTLDTQAVASPVNLGQPVEDNATLSGLATLPGTTNGVPDPINPTDDGAAAGGKITFTLKGPDSCTTDALGTGTNPQDFTNISGNGTYGPVSFIPNAPGTYHWKAQYFAATGDPNNLNSAEHNTSCGDSDEDVVVNQVTPTITTNQSWVPNDSATITADGGGNLQGNVRFRAYTNSSCTGDPFYDSGNIAVSGTSSETRSSSNTQAITSTTTTTVSWLVEYTSTNTAHTNVTSACNTEQSTVTIDNDTTN